MALNTRATILEYIRGKGRGWVFTPIDFPEEAGGAEAARSLLRALRHRGRLREVAPDVFHLPRRIRALGVEVPPDPMRVAKAVARLRGHRVAMSGAGAANCLGLSTQVPAKPIYVTDGPDEEIPLGKLTVVLRHAPPVYLLVEGEMERNLVQALLYLGQDGVDERAIRKLRGAVPAQRRRKVLAASDQVGGWVGEVMRAVAAPSADEVPARG